MTMDMDEYRADVVRTTACPACLAEKGERCVRLPAPGATSLVPDWVDYIHDDRSLAYGTRDAPGEELAILKLPISVRGIDRLVKALAEVYNDDDLYIYTEHDYGSEFLVIGRKH